MRISSLCDPVAGTIYKSALEYQSPADLNFNTKREKYGNISKRKYYRTKTLIRYNVLDPIKAYCINKKTQSRTGIQRDVLTRN